MAAITALRDGEKFIREAIDRYAVIRDLSVDLLGRIDGAVVPVPRGAFYLFFQLPGTVDSVTFCQELLDETGVVLAPGAAFGRGREGWIRLCFATEPERLAKALDRLAAFVSRTSQA